MEPHVAMQRERTASERKEPIVSHVLIDGLCTHTNEIMSDVHEKLRIPQRAFHSPILPAHHLSSS
jgi:hypothetical protein